MAGQLEYVSIASGLCRIVWHRQRSEFYTLFPSHLMQNHKRKSKESVKKSFFLIKKNNHRVFNLAMPYIAAIQKIASFLCIFNVELINCFLESRIGIQTVIFVGVLAHVGQLR